MQKQGFNNTKHATSPCTQPINHPGDGVTVINNKVYLSQALDKVSSMLCAMHTKLIL